MVCQDDTEYASRPHMNLKAAHLERTLDLRYEIFVNTYPYDLGALHILSDIWNYLRSVGLEGHRTLVHVVNEQL